MRVLVQALVASVALGFGGYTLAADMPMYSKAPAPAAFDWGGVYIGGHIGGGWDTVTYADPGAGSTLNNCCLLISTTNMPTGSTKSNNSSFLGGGQVGWMYQIGRLVVGSDVDWSSTSLKTTGAGPTFSAILPGGPFSNETYSLKTSWTATSTAVVGVARDHWLFYSKAGVAWAHDDYGVGVSGIGGTFGGPGGAPFAFTGVNTETVTGWTVGVGLKWAMTDNWFFNVEYNYLDFGSKAQDLNGVFTARPAGFLPGASNGATFSPTFNQNISEVKVGLNYKFSPGFLIFF